MIKNLKCALLGLGAMGLFASASQATAQQKDIPIALVAPLSGPWARGGENLRHGAELAVEDINKAGGVNGIPLRLVVADAGDSPDKARNAIQRLIAEEPNLVGGTGSWLSSFTLAVTEVTERASIPWLTGSFSDQITDRGFKYVFQMPPTGAKQAATLLPVVMQVAEAAGKKPTTVGVITDNTPAPLGVLKPMREGGFAAIGLKAVVDQTFTPPLADATSLVQAVRAARPDWLFMPPTSTQDVKLLVEKLNEFGLGKGRLPIVANSGALTVPEILKLVNPDLLQGVMNALAQWPTKEHDDLLARFKAKYNEPWMTSDSLEAYGDVQLLKVAIEKAGAADAKKVADALRSIDITDGPASYFSGHRIRFDEKGRRPDATLVVVQFQNGVPVLVYPSDVAAAKPIWGTGK
jgi:branched-chain amino acid transport system substrate-binding protein